jgi:8-oxo-dGTP diphosphatase
MINEDVGVRAYIAVVDQHRILLISKPNKESGGIRWWLPGGQVTSGEPVSAVARRKFEEEIGFQAEIIGILDLEEIVIPVNAFHSLIVTFLGRLMVDAARPLEEVISKKARWFSWQELQSIDYQPRPPVQKALDLIPLSI